MSIQIVCIGNMAMHNKREPFDNICLLSYRNPVISIVFGID